MRRAGLFYSGVRMTLPKMTSGTFKAQPQKKDYLPGFLCPELLTRHGCKIQKICPFWTRPRGSKSWKSVRIRIRHLAWKLGFLLQHIEQCAYNYSPIPRFFSRVHKHGSDAKTFLSCSQTWTKESGQIANLKRQLRHAHRTVANIDRATLVSGDPWTWNPKLRLWICSSAIVQIQNLCNMRQDCD